MNKIVPVILSGGSGTRLWPLSREAYPKQFLPLLGTQTLLQETALRTADRNRFAAPVVIANADHRFIIAEQLRAVGIGDATIILEPMGRNTGPAAVVASLAAADRQPDALVLLMPADHAITDQPAFLAATDRGRAAAAAGEIVLFGIPATRPDTGYGYICAGAETPAAGLRRIDRFVEKPDRPTAEKYCRQGFLWNSGIFLFSARRMLAEFERFEPEMVGHVRQAVADSVRDLDFLRLAPAPFGQARSISIDKAVMERTDRAVVVPAAMGWSDIGAWSALWDIAAKDAHANVAIGDVHFERVGRSYVRSDGPAVAAVGVDDLVIVASHDAVLVAGMGAQQDLAAAVARLRAARHPAAVTVDQAHRPWGSTRLLHQTARSQVRQMTIGPGRSLSPHRHERRAEHWTVVSGSAQVIVGDEERALGENSSIGIPIGVVHVITNAGDSPLQVIEIQSGSSFGEDDIVPA